MRNFMLLWVPAAVALVHGSTALKQAELDYYHDAAALLRAWMSKVSIGPHTDTKLCVTNVNRPRLWVTLCGRDHLKFKCLVDLVRPVVNERNVIDAFARVARRPLLVIRPMPSKFIPSSAGAGKSSMGDAASHSLVSVPTATATESPNFASGEAEKRAQRGQ